VPGLAKEAAIDFGIRGVDAEPRSGYRLTKTRNEHLQAFSNAAWQRHEAHHLGQAGPSTQWPSSVAFHSNWPLLAGDLVIASWKVDGAAAADLPLVDEVEEADRDLLDPKPPPEVSWRDTFRVELAGSPGILQDLNNDVVGDGIELVLERAQLSAGERAVMRGKLAGDEHRAIAEDLGWRPQTVETLIRNAEDRLRWLGQNPGVQKERGNVFSRNGHHDRARTPHVSVPAGARKRDHAQPRAG
jgi:hypothetical protein